MVRWGPSLFSWFCLCLRFWPWVSGITGKLSALRALSKQDSKDVYQSHKRIAGVGLLGLR